MARTITVFSTVDQSRVVAENDNSRTWGDVLRNHPNIRAVVAPDMEIIVRETRTAIQSEESVLPEGSISVFLTPGKVKSGSDDVTGDPVGEEGAEGVDGLEQPSAEELRQIQTENLPEAVVAEEVTEAVSLAKEVSINSTNS